MSVETFVRMFKSEPWMDQAACKGVPIKVFYPSPKARCDEAFAEARSYCANCPVQVECSTAGRSEMFGVWGGLAPRERTPLPTPRRPPVVGHGTNAGYKAHRLRGEEACDDCLVARRESQRYYDAARRQRLREAS